MERPIDIFISYAHEDESMVQAVLNHLAVFDRQKMIRQWHDRQIPPGTEWRGQIDSRLNCSDIILLFISSDFLASDYCYDTEMNQALSRHRAGIARVIPVILRPCAWQTAPFATLQLLPTDGEALTKWANRDDACLNIVEGIMRVVRELSSQAQTSSETSAGAVPTGHIGDQDLGIRSVGCLTPTNDIPSVGRSLVECSSPLCRSQHLDLKDLIQISALKANADGWTAHGVVRIDYCVHGHCRTCGRIFETAKRGIPVHFPELACNECGQQAFLEYQVQEIKKVTDGFEFSVNVRCSSCRGKKRLTKVLTGLLNVVGIEVGPAGITIRREEQGGGQI